MMAVPVPDLLQMMHPAYTLVHNNRLIAESEVLSLLDYGERLVERFEHYGSMEVAPKDLMLLLRNSFTTLLESDEPAEVLPVREFLPRLLEELEATVQNMCKAFPNEERIRKFYSAMVDQYYSAYDVVTGGATRD